MKILIATEKPFAAVAVNGIRDIAQKNGHEVAVLEKYTSVSKLLDAVADADALIVRSGAGAECERAGLLFKGQKVAVDKIKSNFGRIGKYRWINLDYCKRVKE